METLLVKIPEAARALSLGRSMLYRLVGSGEIPIVRIGGAVRIPADGLRAWVAAQNSGEVEGQPLQLNVRIAYSP